MILNYSSFSEIMVVSGVHLICNDYSHNKLGRFMIWCWLSEVLTKVIKWRCDNTRVQWKENKNLKRLPLKTKHTQKSENLDTRFY